VHAQVPTTPLLPITTNTHVVALQLGNVYLLMAFIGIAVLYTTKESAVVRGYIFALLLGDIGHLYVFTTIADGAVKLMWTSRAMTHYGLGFTAFTDVRNWNDMAWGNIGITSFLMFARAAYLLGLFGKDRLPVAEKKLI
jgi:hypothetical protein